MKKLVSLVTACVLAFMTVSAYAYVTCWVANKRGMHWTFTAPSQGQAYALAQSHCAANSYNFANCNPVCNSSSSWHCFVANKKGQHWSFTAPSQQAAFNMAQNACDANSNNFANCNPVCSPF